MTATTNLPAEEQHLLVYAGISAVAAACDGAIEQDGVGFNGQDTKFGKRIASVPFEEWTGEIKTEAARIARTYRAQIEQYLGFDITALPVVQEAAAGTNHIARNQARAIERRAEGASLKDHRKATLLEDGRIALTWHKKDPDCFGALLDGVRSLPGRRWTGSRNEVDLSVEAVAFIEEFAIDADFDLEVAAVEAVHVAEEKAAEPNIVLDGDRVRISFPYDAGMVSGVRRLPGRRYDGATKTNTADIHPEVLAFADEFSLVVDPAVVEAIESLGAAVAEAQTEAQIRRTVSALADPAALPAEFVQRVLAATPKAMLV